MSDYEFDDGGGFDDGDFGDGGFDGFDDGGFDNYDGAPAFDSAAYGAALQGVVEEAVGSAVQQMIAAQFPQQSPHAVSAADWQPPAPQATPEQTAAWHAELHTRLDGLAKTVGDFDRQAALEAADHVFKQELDANPAADVGALLDHSLAAGAELAATYHRGNHVAEGLVEAELVRNPRLDAGEVRQLAEEIALDLEAQGLPPTPELAQFATTRAAHALSGDRPRTLLNGDELVRYHATRGQALERADKPAVPAHVQAPKPGQRLSFDQILHGFKTTPARRQS